MSEDDQCSPKECIRLMEQHFPRDKADNFRIVAYPDAGHLVEPPYTPLCAMTYFKEYGKYLQNPLNAFRIRKRIPLRMRLSTQNEAQCHELVGFETIKYTAT